jgi:hypothetical protein
VRNHLRKNADALTVLHHRINDLEKEIAEMRKELGLKEKVIDINRNKKKRWWSGMK